MTGDLGRRTAALAVAALVAVLAALFVPTLSFGVPSADRLRALTGRPRPTPEEVRRMARAWEDLSRRDEPTKAIVGRVRLEGDAGAEGERYRILRRMCLYTTEPDEMQTMLALGRMRPRSLDFDPHLYQYGGGLIYGSAATVFAAGLVGAVPLAGGVETLLEEPARAAAAYIAARLWPFLLVLLLPVATYRLGRIFLDRRHALLAAAAAIWIPALFHIAPALKPQPMATTIGLAAVYLSLRALDRGRLKDHLRAGAVHGAVAGVMFTQGVLFVAHLGVLLAEARRSPAAAARSALASIAAAAAVFLATNPYWIISFEGVLDDMRRTAAWYPPDPAPDRLMKILLFVIPAGISGPVFAAGLVASLFALLKGRTGERILAATYAVLLVLFAHRTSGTDLEAGWSRNFLLLGPVGVVLAVAAVRRLAPRWSLPATAVLALVFAGGTVPRSLLAVANLRADGPAENTRYVAGRWIEAHVPSGTRIYAATASPAPVSLPFVSIDRYPFADLEAGPAPAASDLVAVVRPNRTVDDRLRAMGWRPVRTFPARREILGLGPLETYETEYAAANPTIVLWASPDAPWRGASDIDPARPSD